MAPPTRLRPHLDNLLQKNLELEHVVADLRHQLTQSAAKWADERKLLAVMCDTLMASFAKFRARLDVHSSDWGDSEGEVEQHLDAGGQNEDTEVGYGAFKAKHDRPGDQGSTMTEHLHERCHVLATELQIKEEELEESRRRHEAAEEELQRVQRLLESQSKQLREALAFGKADTECTAHDTSAQANPSQTEFDDALKKLDVASQETNRLKQLLQQWQKYGNDWKREAQSVQTRTSQLELRVLELTAQIKAAEGHSTLPDAERQDVQRLTHALAEQTVALEQQRTACQKSGKQVNDLEAMIALLRAQLTPQRLASFDASQSQSVPAPTQSTKPVTPQADTDTNKRSDMIMLKIPYRSIKKTTADNHESQEEPRNVFSSSPQASTSRSGRVSSPAPPTSKKPVDADPADYELCIHTCNPLLCRNEAQSFLWPRRQMSLPRHALSAKKHRHCTRDCPGNRLLTMPTSEAAKLPRRAKCRPASEAELALAVEESSKMTRASGEQETGAEGVDEREGSGEAEEAVEEGSTREEDGGQESGVEQPARKAEMLHLGKRLRSRQAGESQRARKLRLRGSASGKP